MNWKKFSAACAIISAGLISFPQNIIGCGGSIDPYDYYLSFFNQYAAAQIQYQPFFYTGEQFLFDYEDAVRSEDELVKEWVHFTGNTVSAKDANAFVMKFPAKDISTLYYHIEKKTPATLPDSISKNQLSQFFLKDKNLEALGYILYAKKVEPHVINTDYWEPESRDSIVMDKLLKNGLQLYAAAKTDLFKLKYAYQIVRLAQYNRHYEDAIKYYDDFIANNKTQSVLQPMSLALKAGALFRLGKNGEAAYLFSKAFHQSVAKKISNYNSFGWSVNSGEDRKEYLQYCKNNQEKADMLSLFVLRNADFDISTLKEIYTLDPASDLLSTLIIREINKYEEAYLTPLISKEYNTEIMSIYYYYQYTSKETDDLLYKQRPQLVNFMNFLNTVADEKKVKDAALTRLAAAYSAYMLRDFAKANELLAKTKGLKMSSKIEDQWMLTNLLVQVSSQQKIDADFENKILPSVQWLYNKVDAFKKDSNINTNTDYYRDSEQAQWYRFYRNLMVEILSKRYKAQGNIDKALLAIGSAENHLDNYYELTTGYLHNQLNGKQAENLYDFLSAKKFTPYEQFLVTHNALQIKDVVDFAGTAYLRDYNYDKAIEWLQKKGNQHEVIEKDPFKELMYDREERLPKDEVTTSKLAYAKEMKRLSTLVKDDPKNAPAYLYKMALGYYNVTYYGYAWELVEYFRSGSDGYYVPKNATSFQKDYYTASTAESYFKKAMDASTDPEFKAKCLFMMAKCSQKQVPKPQYADFEDYDDYSLESDKYILKFADGKYYPQLKREFGNTQFYKEALTRCSYLSDFAAK